MRISHTVLRQSCSVLAVVVFALSTTAEAQVHAAQPELPAAAPTSTPLDPDTLVLQTYQIADLLLNAPDYPYLGSRNSAPSFGGRGMGGGGFGGGGGGIGGGGFFSVSPQFGAGGGEEGAQMGMGGGGSSPAEADSQDSLANPNRIVIDDLIETLTSVVEPDSWDDVGGPGSVQRLGSLLVIRQTPEIHEQIEELFSQLREGANGQQTVAVDARWLYLDSDELERLLPPVEEGEPEMDREALAEFTRRPSSIRALTNCFNGQLVYLVSGTRRNVVTGVTPVVGSLEEPRSWEQQQYASRGSGSKFSLASQMGVPQRSVGYQPIVERPNFGVLLEIRPTVVPGRDTVVVDLRSTITMPGQPQAAFAGDPSQNPLVPPVDRLAIETQQLATTLSAPLGRPVLAGGLTFATPATDATDQDAQEPGEAPQLYLILELR